MKFLPILVLGSASIGALAIGCAVTTVTPGDAGKLPATDAGKDVTAQPDADASQTPNACAPDLTGFSDPAYKNANRVAGACTTAQIDAAYEACWSLSAQAGACETWYTSAVNTTCDSCLFGTIDNAKLTPIIFSDTGATINTAGCLELSGLPVSCAGAYSTAIACGDFACAPCFDAGAAASGEEGEDFSDAEWDNYVACLSDAETGGCAPKWTAADTCLTVKEADGGVSTPQLDACLFPDESDAVAYKAFFLKFTGGFCGQ